ncbi:MAG: FtsX-like permease family protein [Gemmatimonadaceae bacterium]
MLSPRWRKVLRDLWLHKARTGLAISAICIGIIGAGAVLDAWSLLRRATREEFDASRPASAVIRTDSVDAALLARIRALPGIATAQSRHVVSARVRTPAGVQTALLIARDDFAANEIGVVKPGDGAWPPSQGHAVVEHSSVEFAGVAIGDSVELQIGDGPAAMSRVSGIARDVGLAPGWMEHVVYIFVSPADLARIGATSGMNEIQVAVADRSLGRTEIQAIARDVRALVERTGRRVSSVDVPIPGRHIHAGQIDSLLYTQGAFGLLALVLSGVLVVNLIAAMLTGQVREIGVMKAIGAGAGQIAAMYLGLAFSLGIVACAISIPLAAVFGRMYAEFTAGILNFDVSAYRIPVWAFALQLAVGALLPVVAALFPVVRGCRISVNDALRDFGISGRGETPRLIVGGRIFTRPVLLSLRNAFRRRARMALTLATLAIGGAVYLGALNLRGAVIGAVDLLFAPQQFDMVFRLAHPAPAESIAAVVTPMAGVSAAESWAGARAALATDGAPLGNSFTITAPPAGTRMLVPRILTGHWFTSAGNNELVVSNRVVDDDSAFALGRTVALVIDGRSATWTIVGVADGGPMPVTYASREALARVTGSTGATTIVVATGVAGQAAELALVRRVRSELADRGFDVSSSQLMAEQRAVIQDHLLMVAGFLGNMSLLMIVVGGLGLASTMSLAVLERTREIGVLRAIGARHRTILGMIQVEGLVIAILSWLIAIPLSLPMSIALGNAFGRVMLEVPVHLLPDGPGVLRWFTVVVLLSVVACAWPAWRAMRITTSSALAA